MSGIGSLPGHSAILPDRPAPPVEGPAHLEGPALQPALRQPLADVAAEEPIVSLDDVEAQPVAQAQGPVVAQPFAELHPMSRDDARAWIAGNDNRVPTSITASGEHLVVTIGDQSVKVSARDLEKLLSFGDQGQSTALAQSLMIFDAANKSGLPPGATRAILTAYRKQVARHGPGEGAMRQALQQIALAADVENYVKNPKGLARDMRHVAAFTGEADQGLHLKKLLKKQPQAVKDEAIRQHQYVLDSALNEFAAAFNTARETGDYAGAFDAQQRFFQRAGTITTTAYWQARPKIVATDLAPPERPAAPSDLSLDFDSRKRPTAQAAGGRQARIDQAKPVTPGRWDRFKSWVGAIGSPGEVATLQQRAALHTRLEAPVKQAQTDVERLGLSLERATFMLSAEELAEPEKALEVAGIRADLATAQTALTTATQRYTQSFPGLVSVDSAQGILRRLHADGTIPASGPAHGQVTTRALDLREVIVGVGNTADQVPDDDLQGMASVQRRTLSSWEDLKGLVRDLRATQESVHRATGDWRPVVLDLVMHGNDWGMLEVIDKTAGHQTKSYTSAAWINKLLWETGFRPEDITVVSEACNGAFVYERSRDGIAKDLDVPAQIAKLNRTSPGTARTVYDVSGSDRTPGRTRAPERDFVWVGRETYSNKGPSVLHQYVSGLGMPEAVLQSEAGRRHTVTTGVFLRGDVLREHLPVVSLNTARPAFTSKGAAPVLVRDPGNMTVRKELRLDSLAVQAALQGRDDAALTAERAAIAPSTLRSTGAPSLNLQLNPGGDDD